MGFMVGFAVGIVVMTCVGLLIVSGVVRDFETIPKK